MTEPFVFRGRIRDDKHCYLTIGLAKIPEAGRPPESVPFRSVRALIDTGATGFAVSERLKEKLGLTIATDRDAVVPGRSKFRAQMAQIAFCLWGDDGRALYGCAWTGVAVLDRPNAPELLIGMEQLRFGTFTVNGPAGIWEWRIEGEPFMRC